MLRIPGHVLGALAKATIVPSKSNSGTRPLTLTIVLKRDYQPGFERYLRELYDPHSPNFHRFLTPQQLADRFGPSRQPYDAVRVYLHAQGFWMERGSTDRLTITTNGTRADAERAFALKIANYRIGGREFYANPTDPALPAQLALHVQAVIGLSNLAKPKRSFHVIGTKAFYVGVT